jgi:hypothetical protein
MTATQAKQNNRQGQTHFVSSMKMTRRGKAEYGMAKATKLAVLDCLNAGAARNVEKAGANCSSTTRPMQGRSALTLTRSLGLHSQVAFCRALRHLR